MNAFKFSSSVKEDFKNYIRSNRNENRYFTSNVITRNEK